MSGIDQPAERLRTSPAQFEGRLDPFPDDHFGVYNRLLIRCTVGCTACQLRHLGDICIICDMELGCNRLVNDDILYVEACVRGIGKKEKCSMTPRC